MSIIQISKIQVRTGNIDDLPQLSVGELGWAADAKRLFIGNEPNVVGPIPDNTEILTSGSPVTPAGPNGAIQFNQDGALNGTNFLTFTNGTQSGILSVNGNIATLDNGRYDIGSSANKWKDFYLSNAIFIGNSSIYSNGSNIVISNLTVSNLVLGDDLDLPGNLSVGGNTFLAGPLSASNINGANISASGNINSMGVITSSSSITATGNIIGSNVQTSGQVLAGSVSANGNINGTNITSTNLINANNITSTGSISASGNISGGNVTTGGKVVATGNVETSSYLLGNGIFITGLPAGYSNSDVANYIAIFNGNILANNIEVTGNLTIDKDIIHEGNIINDGNLSVTGNAVIDGAVITDLIQSKTGDITLRAIGTNNHIYLDPSPGGWTDAGNSRIANLILVPEDDQDAASKFYVDQLAQGIKPKIPCIVGTTEELPGTVVYDNGPANDGIGSTLTITPAITSIDGVSLSLGMRVLVKNEGNYDIVNPKSTWNGIYTVTTLGASTVLTRPQDAYVALEWPDGSFVFVEEGTEQAGTGWVLVTDITTVGISPLLIQQVSAPGTYAAGTGLDLNGTIFSIANTTVVAGTYGSGGLRKLPVFDVNDQGQLINAGVEDIQAAGSNNQVQFNNGDLFDGSSKFTFEEPSGNLSLIGNVNSTGRVAGATLSGSIVTPNQPNITTIGTLNSLNVTGTTVSGSFSGSGAQLTNLNGANVSGTVPLSANANYSDFSGTIVNSFQPNITTVGTLISLTVSGNASVGNVNATNGSFTGTVSATNLQGSVTAPSVRTGNLTTGGEGISGTITGVWTLAGSSRMEATYADLAERYKSDQCYEPGTVLMIGGTHEVTIADETGKYKLAGVVSTDPAYVLNSHIDQSVVIALAGRVPCKVVGKIEKGDLLTISHIPGVATSTNENSGPCIIGRALNYYNNEKVGKIEIKVDRG